MSNCKHEFVYQSLGWRGAFRYGYVCRFCGVQQEKKSTPGVGIRNITVENSGIFISSGIIKGDCIMKFTCLDCGFTESKDATNGISFGSCPECGSRSCCIDGGDK